MKALKLLLLAAVLAASLAPAASVGAQEYEPQQDLMLPRYFPETGFWVQGHFREYWETRGGLYVFGYPITGVFEQDGIYKQYFQRAVFEYHPENAGTEYEVLLMLLGNELAKDQRGEAAFQPIAPFEDNRDHRYFDATGHSVSYGFKTFWENNQGQRNFGYPISQEFDERNQPPPAGDGEVHTVQYFERNRFEWHPQHKGTKYEYQLGLLGVEYKQQHGVPEGVDEPQDPSMPPYDPIRDVQYGPHVGYGFNTFFRGDDQGRPYHDKMFDVIENAGFNWIKIQAQWRELHRQPGFIDPVPLDRIINHAHERGINVVVSVAKTPTWVDPEGGIPDNVEPFREFMEYMANRYDGKVQGWEIWNEQNLAHEVGGYVEPADYVRLLKAGYNGVKAGDPQAPVLFGGLTPTGVTNPEIAIDDVRYLEQIYAYNNGEVKQYFDHLAAHPGSNNNPPDTMYPDNPGPGEWSNHPSFYFRRIEQQREVMERHGDAAKQIWLTEFGWSTANQAPGYEYGAEISEQEQAQYLVRAYEIAKQEWPWMGVMMVWNLNYSTTVPPSDEKFPWSVVNPDWSPRPAYEALRDMPK